MPATFEPIATTTLGSAASSITFSSIPGTYTDLRLIFLPSYSGANSVFHLTFNNITTTTYSFTRIVGTGTSVVSSRQTGITEMEIGLTANGIGLTTTDIFSYAGSTNKTVLSQSSSDSNGSGQFRSYVGLARNTAAITRVDITTNGAFNFASGTTATLYGIKAA